MADRKGQALYSELRRLVVATPRNNGVAATPETKMLLATMTSEQKHTFEVAFYGVSRG